MAILKGIKFTDSDEIHKLDYEEAIENKPFYVEGVMEIDLLPKQDLTFENYTYMHSALFGLVEGNTYKVEYDGALYECVCGTIDDEGVTMDYIGNDTEFGGTNNVPFIVADNPLYSQGMIMAISEGNTHNIRIYHDGEAVHQLDPKYVNAYTKEEIDNLVKTLSLKIQAMFDNLTDGDEVAY